MNAAKPPLLQKVRFAPSLTTPALPWKGGEWLPSTTFIVFHPLPVQADGLVAAVFFAEVHGYLLAPLARHVDYCAKIGTR